MLRRYLIFGLISLAILMSSIDNTIIAVGLPAIRHGLHTSLLLAGWTITAFQLGQLLTMPLAGKMSDELGRKRIFLAGVLIFTVASFLCGFAPNIYVLIVCRLLQAVGGGAVLPSCVGIAADTFPEQRARAVGFFSSIFPIGGVIGPNLGGVIIDHFSWRFIFYINVPIGIAVLLLTAWLYRPQEEARVPRKIDFSGVAIYGAALSVLLLDLSWLGQHPREATSTPLLWLSAVFACGLVWLWFRHEARTPEPMMDIALLKQRPFLAANVYGLLWGAGVFGFISFLPTYAQLHYHMSATAAGLLLTPRSIIMIVSSTLASFFLLRFGYRLPMIAGILLVWFSLLLTGIGPEHPSLLGVHFSGFAYLTTVVAILGLGFGLSGPASNNAALDIMPGKIAAITGIRATVRQTGGTLGTGVTIFVISLFSDPGRGMQVMFVILSFVLLTVIPWVFLIPDTARQARKAARDNVVQPRAAVAAGDGN